MKIALIHPEMGFGGSERLMLDAAIELRRRGHDAPLFTARCDRDATFRDVSSRDADVRVRATSLPYDLGGRARVPCAMARMTALAAAARRELGRVDLVLCDLVAQAVPFVRRVAQAPVAFYCHYPDQLLAPDGGATYSWYRKGIDALERRGLAQSAIVLTNSAYTSAALRRTAPALAPDAVRVVAPGIDVERWAAVAPLAPGWSRDGEVVILSLGRFHRDKNHMLAIEAMAALQRRLPSAVAQRLRLVIAGGHDASLPESRALVAALRADIEARALGHCVTLDLSPSDEAVVQHVGRASVVMHTAVAEHFGIAPIEAMAAGRPVVAVNHAGPSETIIDGRTGLLRAPTGDAFADAVAALIVDESMALTIGDRARAHARERYARTAFGDRMNEALRVAVSRRRD